MSSKDSMEVDSTHNSFSQSLSPLSGSQHKDPTCDPSRAPLDTAMDVEKAIRNIIKGKRSVSSSSSADSSLKKNVL